MSLYNMNVLMQEECPHANCRLARQSSEIQAIVAHPYDGEQIHHKDMSTCPKDRGKDMSTCPKDRGKDMSTCPKDDKERHNVRVITCHMKIRAAVTGT
jgi:hypothetical protein